MILYYGLNKTVFVTPQGLQIYAPIPELRARDVAIRSVHFCGATTLQAQRPPSLCSGVNEAVSPSASAKQPAAEEGSGSALAFTAVLVSHCALSGSATRALWRQVRNLRFLTM